MKRVITTLALVATIMAAGCDERQRAVTSMAANVGVQILVAKVIERSPDQKETAQKLIDAVDQAVNSGNLHGIGDRIRYEIGYSKLPMSEQLAVDALLISADQYIHDNMSPAQERIAKGWLNNVRIGAMRFL